MSIYLRLSKPLIERACYSRSMGRPIQLTLSRNLQSYNKYNIINCRSFHIQNKFYKNIKNKENITDEDLDSLKNDVKKYLADIQNNKISGRDLNKEKEISEKMQKIESIIKTQMKSKDDSNMFNSSTNRETELDSKKATESASKKEDLRKAFNEEPTASNNNVALFQLGILFLFLSLILDKLNTTGEAEEITWQEFYSDYFMKGFVSSITVINKSVVKVELNQNGKHQSNNKSLDYYYFNVGSINNFENQLADAQKDLKEAGFVSVPVNYVQKGNWAKISLQILPTVLLIVGFIWLTRRSALNAGNGRGGIFGMSKSKAKRFNTESDVKIRFKDVAGCDEAKQEIMEFVDFLKHPSRYEKMGAKIPRGAILSGPPGTGKTLLAKATAGEAGVPFYFVSGSEFVEMFVGVGASRVRDLFKTAKENAPSIVFIDEIDAIGKARQKGNFSGANDERENTLNQLLVEMDGFTTADHIVVLAGTNRPDILDKALLRPGRFDRHVNIDRPELEGRKDIFAVHLKKIKIAGSLFDLKNRLATLTPGFSGADIANVCNEAALIAARYDATSVKLKDFEQAIERVMGGVERKSKLLLPEEKQVVAYHEAGHAICGWYLKYADPLLKVSIIPRGQGALGYAQYLPGDLYLLSEQQLLDRITMALGGRVSEELHFPSVTSGAHDDFKKITGMATAMVTELGMSEKIGWLCYKKNNDNDLTKPFSEETADVVDAEVSKIIQTCHKRCTELLKEKAEELEKIAQLLLQKEVLTREDMINLLGKRPFPERNDAFDKYLNETETKRIEEEENKNNNKQQENDAPENSQPAF